MARGIRQTYQRFRFFPVFFDATIWEGRVLDICNASIHPLRGADHATPAHRQAGDTEAPEGSDHRRGPIVPQAETGPRLPPDSLARRAAYWPWAPTQDKAESRLAQSELVHPRVLPRTGVTREPGRHSKGSGTAHWRGPTIHVIGCWGARTDATRAPFPATTPEQADGLWQRTQGKG